MTNIEALTAFIEAQANVPAREFDAAEFLRLAEACTPEERRTLARRYQGELEARDHRTSHLRIMAERAATDEEADPLWDEYEALQAASAHAGESIDLEFDNL